MNAAAALIPQMKDVEQLISALDVARIRRAEWQEAEAIAAAKRREYVAAVGVVRALTPDNSDQVLA